jgi:hypothetical protein
MTLISVRSVTALLGSFRCSSCVVSFFLSRDARVCGSGPVAGRLIRRAFWTMQLGFELRFFGAFPIGMISVLQSTAMVRGLLHCLLCPILKIARDTVI